MFDEIERMLRGTLASGRVSAFGWSLRTGSVALILSVLPVCSVVMIRLFSLWRRALTHVRATDTWPASPGRYR